MHSVHFEKEDETLMVGIDVVIRQCLSYRVPVSS